jgi:hypothetical protein
MARDYNNSVLSLFIVDFYEQLEIEKSKIRLIEHNQRLIEANNEMLKQLMVMKSKNEVLIVEKLRYLDSAWISNADRIDHIEDRLDKLEHPPFVE